MRIFSLRSGGLFGDWALNSGFLYESAPPQRPSLAARAPCAADDRVDARTAAGSRPARAVCGGVAPSVARVDVAVAGRPRAAGARAAHRGAGPAATRRG